MAMTDKERAAIETSLKAFETYVCVLLYRAMHPGMPITGLDAARDQLLDAFVETATVLGDEDRRQAQRSAEL